MCALNHNYLATLQGQRVSIVRFLWHFDLCPFEWPGLGSVSMMRILELYANVICKISVSFNSIFLFLYCY